jgi:hypothetical protein
VDRAAEGDFRGAAAAGVKAIGVGVTTGIAIGEVGAAAVNAGAATSAKGGTYKLVDPSTGDVARTGRTNNLDRRLDEHARSPETGGLVFEVDRRTDDYAEQRGREQVLHDHHKPPLNKIQPISPRNPRRSDYLDAAKKME